MGYRQRMRRQGRRPPRPHGGGDVYAAIDLGTNNCRMLMARPDRNGFRVIDSFSRIVRLGEGLSAGDSLRDDAIDRTIDALKVCATKVGRRGARRLRGVATEACRRAANAEAFLARVEDETGLHLEQISAAEEADLILAGSAQLLGIGSSSALVFDATPKVVDMMSLPLGVVMLAEHLADGAGDAYRAVLDDFDRALADFDARHRVSAEIADGTVQMLGTSGTVTTVGALHLGLTRYDRSRVDGMHLAFDDIEAVVAGVAAMSLDERAAHPCVGRQRADLVGVGCDMLDAICRRWPVGALWIADRGIREGLLLAMMADDDALARPQPAAACGGEAQPSAP